MVTSHGGSAPATSKKSRFVDQVRFFGALLRSPKQTGAVAPTSKKLADLMASNIRVHESLPVLELGPGTGAITSGILRTGMAPDRLWAVEYSPKFCRDLRSRFPGTHIVEGNAFALEKTLGDDAPAVFDCVISGLPLLNFELSERIKLVRSGLERVPPGRPFVQFSYGVRAPVELDDPDVEMTRSTWVFGNVPPARVWLYRLKS